MSPMLAEDNVRLLRQGIELLRSMDDATYTREVAACFGGWVGGHVRHCQVEILPGQYGYIPVASTDLQAIPRPEPTVLTLAAIEELVVCAQGLGITRKARHATTRKPRSLGPSTARRTSGSGRGNRSRPHGGGR